MGIFIHLNIAGSVTDAEWEPVYEESLQLARHLSVASIVEKEIHGVKTRCLVLTEELKRLNNRTGEVYFRGWDADGDYEHLNVSEENCTPRCLENRNRNAANIQDAMMSKLYDYLEHDEWEKVSKSIHRLWHGKTQGEPHHISLLAVGALVEARLGKRAFVSGDITIGQCRKAVRLANEWLAEPIDLPVSCCLDKLYERIADYPLTQVEKIKLLKDIYLGSKGEAFGQFLRENYSEADLTAYWQKRSANEHIDYVVHEYLLWGFALEDICGCMTFQDRNGESTHKDFVTAVMDAKLHWETKNCKDYVSINPEAECAYTVMDLMAGFVLRGAENYKIDRYIPLDEIRSSLEAGIGDVFDVQQCIDDYMQQEAEEVGEQDVADRFTEIAENKMQEMRQMREEYDIVDAAELKFFVKGDRVRSGLKRAMGKSRVFLDGDAAQSEYLQKALKLDAAERCAWLGDRSYRLHLRDKDWEKIYAEVEQDAKALLRYGAILIVNMEHQDIQNMCVALMINDDLYAASADWAEEVKAENKD